MRDEYDVTPDTEEEFIFDEGELDEDEGFVIDLDENAGMDDDSLDMEIIEGKASTGEIRYSLNSGQDSNKRKLSDYVADTLRLMENYSQPIRESLSVSLFSNTNELENAKHARESLLSSPVDSTIKKYKELEAEKQKARINNLLNHVKYSHTVYSRFESFLSDAVDDTRRAIDTIAKAIREQENSDSSTYARKKLTDLKMTELKLNHKQLMQRYYGAYRRYEDYTLATSKVGDFLSAFCTAYSEYSSHYLNSIYSEGAFFSFEVDDTHFTYTCKSCSENSIAHIKELPHLETGRMSYTIDILQILKDMYALYSDLENKLRSKAVEILLSGAEKANKVDLIAKASTKTDLLEKIMILHTREVVSNIPDAKAQNYYNQSLFPHVSTYHKTDLRLKILPVLKTLCIEDKHLLPNRTVDERQARIAKYAYKDLAVPTERNVLKNRHPLLRKSVIDTINANSKSNTGVPVWKEILTRNIKPVEDRSKLTQEELRHLAEHNGRNIYKNNLEFIEFVMGELDKIFMYPNPDLVSDKTNITYSAAKLKGEITVVPKSPLRFVVPTLKCKGCGKHLLLHTTIMTAMTNYIDHMRQLDTETDTTESSVVNMIGIMAPAIEPRLKKVFEHKKTSYNYLDRIKAYQNKSSDELETRGQGDNQVGTSKITKEGSKQARHRRLMTAMQMHGFVSERLASEYCLAEDRRDTIRMAELLEENTKRKQANSLAFQKVEPQATPVEPQATQEEINEVKTKYSYLTDEIAKAYVIAEKKGDTETVNAIIEHNEERSSDIQEDNLVNTLLAEYGDVDLDTLTYEELTEKGLYKYENLCKVYNVNSVEFDSVEQILISVMGDDKSIATLPQAIRDSIEDNYEIKDGAPKDMMELFGF